MALQLGPLTIHWYGVFVALGFLVGMWSASRRGRQVGLKPETILDFGIWMILAGIAGARLFYVVGHWEEFRGNWLEIVRVDHGGLVFYGGFILATVTAIWFVRRRRLHFWQLADVMAPSLALGHAFGRVGCFLNGCCYGKPCSLPWAVRFPAGHETGGVPVHPTQLYETAGNLVLFALLQWAFPKRRFDGQIFWLYVVGYAVVRFADEFWRGDYETYLFGGRLAPGQATALVLLVIAGGFLWKMSRRRTG